MGDGYSRMGLPDLLALAADEDAGLISRRGVFIGLSATIAAPFVIRTSGILMPVRDRTEHLIFGRDWKRCPPSPTEVREWRKSLNNLWDQGVFVSWTGEGFMHIGIMADAEKRYEAMGLL